MQKDISEYYKISKSDVDCVSKLFERAFFNWSLAVAIQPDEKIRRTRAHYFYTISIKHMIKYGEAYAISPKMEGVITWVDSEYYEMSMWQMIKYGALKTFYKLGAKAMNKAEISMDFMAKTHSELIEEPHYHLTWLGVDPEHQKKGIGTELMHAILNKFSKENMKCFLDTQDKQNIDYYRRFGFKLIKECQLPNVDVTYWGMLWEP
ncbi:MAG: GNAT family N-acetyltransferase [Candidatus Lokiarchaeota archaeon]|nr:GNAT family N-acetyltransferase [Candidatus Lokiarchaeota archaeon]